MHELDAGDSVSIVRLNSDLAARHVDGNVVVRYYRRDTELFADAFYVDTQRCPYSKSVVERYIACKIANRVCVIGVDHVKICLSAETADCYHAILSDFYFCYDTIIPLATVSSLTVKVYGVALRFSSANISDGGRLRMKPQIVDSDPTAVRDELRYKAGLFFSMNLGHTQTSVACVRVDAVGSKLLKYKRFATIPLQSDDGLSNLVLHNAPEFLDFANELGMRYLGASMSIAETVIAGRIFPNRAGGLFRDTVANGDLERHVSKTVSQLLFVERMLVINDACAEGIYASRIAATYDAGVIRHHRTRLLTIRFGTWPAISYVGDDGYNLSRMNEYSYMSTRVHRYDRKAIVGNVGRILSYQGFGMLAAELGLLEKYNVNEDAALKFFYEALFSRNEDEKRDASLIYVRMGEHIAMLVGELLEDVPIERVSILGSKANAIDRYVFRYIERGFVAFTKAYAIYPSDMKMELIAEASHEASVIGASLQLSERFSDGGCFA
ncbi:MAG TPA: hypothetical protein VN224_07825 [Xanthomonadales bacterium]|nr:hypothetical protein [Xanthomonadales bacterium]